MLDHQTTALLAELDEFNRRAQTRAKGNGMAEARENARAIWLKFAGDHDKTCFSHDVSIAAWDREIPARLYRPENASDAPLPIMVFFHGGGWSLGDLDSYHGLISDLCTRSGVLFLSVDYRLAPEHKFPAGLDDALEAVRWVTSNAETIGADARRIAVMGDSSGGNLATVVAYRLHSEGEIQLAGQFLIYPVLDVSQPHAAYPSRMHYGDGSYFLSREGIDVTVVWYLGDTATGPDSPFVSPLCIDDLSCLPRTIIVVAGHDPLLDEAQAYAARLTDANIDTKLRCYAETIHTFLSFGNLDVCRRARRDLAEDIRALLSVPGNR